NPVPVTVKVADVRPAGTVDGLSRVMVWAWDSSETAARQIAGTNFNHHRNVTSLCIFLLRQQMFRLSGKSEMPGQSPPHPCALLDACSIRRNSGFYLDMRKRREKLTGMEGIFNAFESVA